MSSINNTWFRDEDLHLVRNETHKNTTSRYSRLMQTIDMDYTNRNWEQVDTTKIDTVKSTYNFVDLFSGGGGFSCGVCSTGLNKILSVEVDEDASNTIRANFPTSNHYEGLIENLRQDELENLIGDKKIHAVFGGPPCQGFSVAGLRNPNDPRNRMFKEYIRIVKYIKPDFLVMENVPGMLTSQNGQVYKEVLRQLSDIGYPNTSVRILEAAKYGVPQLRVRAIFIGNRHGVENPYPASTHNESNYVTIESAIGDLCNTPYDSTWNHEGTRHSSDMINRLSEVPPGGSLYETFRDAWKRQRKGFPSMTIKENHGGVHIHYDLNRVLTAREMARLQTFPDNYIFSGTFKRAYWQIGNAVPCLFAKHLALAVKSSLTNLTN